MELHRTNPGSTARLDMIPQLEFLPLFDRLYISLDACKKGFIKGCRPLIGLDGCFLKGYYGGQLLSAVCQMSGLALALKNIFPMAFHRNCVLHIWKNFIKQFKDQNTKQLVWDCARCTTQIEFKAAMEKLKQISVPAWKYLDRFDPAAWSKVFFSPGPKVDNITNNMCEIWNAKIVVYRGMPCRHAVAAMSKMGLRPEDFVHKWLTMKAVKATYSHCIKPVNSEEYWVQSDAPKTLPPPIKRAAHRPNMKRISDPVE
ncbi:uncharacterized protein [Arachis hypogaea]|uniref:uncharacterized protein n=1 Tax=Arachis hypogaea TaxID=3818 RepID=UPI003B21F612